MLLSHVLRTAALPAVTAAIIFLSAGAGAVEPAYADGERSAGLAVRHVPAHRPAKAGSWRRASWQCNPWYGTQRLEGQLFELRKETRAGYCFEHHWDSRRELAYLDATGPQPRAWHRQHQRYHKRYWPAWHLPDYLERVGYEPRWPHP